MDLLIRQKVRRVLAVKAGTFKVSRTKVQAVSLDGTALTFPRQRLVWYSETDRACVLCCDMDVQSDKFQVDKLRKSRLDGFVVGKTAVGKLLINERHLKEE